MTRPPLKAQLQADIDTSLVLFGVAYVDVKTGEVLSPNEIRQLEEDDKNHESTD